MWVVVTSSLKSSGNWNTTSGSKTLKWMNQCVNDNTLQTNCFEALQVTPTCLAQYHLVQVWLDRLCGLFDHMTGSMINSSQQKHLYKGILTFYHFVTHEFTWIGGTCYACSQFQMVVNSQVGLVCRAGNWQKDGEQSQKKGTMRRKNNFKQLLCYWQIRLHIWMWCCVQHISKAL